MDIVDRFLDEHKRLRRMMAELERAAVDGGRGYESAARELFRSFTRHGRSEEALLRELVKKIGRSQPIEELLSEHVLIVRSSYDLKKALDESKAFPDRLLSATHVLLHLLDAHMSKEERLIYPESRRLLDKSILEVMARALEAM